MLKIYKHTATQNQCTVKIRKSIFPSWHQRTFLDLDLLPTKFCPSFIIQDLEIGKQSKLIKARYKFYTYTKKFSLAPCNFLKHYIHYIH